MSGAELAPTPDGIRVRCLERHGVHSFDTWAEADEWMDHHAATVAHDPRWPITFALGWCGREPSGDQGVTYRTPLLSPATTEGKTCLRCGTSWTAPVEECPEGPHGCDGPCDHQDSGECAAQTAGAPTPEPVDDEASRGVGALSLDSAGGSVATGTHEPGCNDLCGPEGHYLLASGVNDGPVVPTSPQTDGADDAPNKSKGGSFAPPCSAGTASENEPKTCPRCGTSWTAPVGDCPHGHLTATPTPVAPTAVEPATSPLTEEAASVGVAPARDTCQAAPPCQHAWLDRPESDTHECLICGTEGSGSISPTRCACPPDECHDGGSAGCYFGEANPSGATA